MQPFGDAAIAQAAALIRQGLPVAVPTETVYGLAADATDGAAVAAIYAAKGRPRFNPLIIHVADLAAAERLARFDDRARSLAARFWPGPLTLVLPRRPDSSIAALATAGLDSIAIRVPAHPAMRALLAAAGRPLAAPSANRSGSISPTRAGHVLASLGGRIPLVIDAGPTALGLESTILGLVDGEARLLRPGPIGEAELGFSFAPASGSGSGSGEITAPGQLQSHYAPSKPVRTEATSAGGDEWLIGFGGIEGDVTLSPTGDLAEAAAALFDRLHEAEAQRLPAIAVAPIPKEGLGIAINDRLGRAAAARET